MNVLQIKVISPSIDKNIILLKSDVETIYSKHKILTIGCKSNRCFQFEFDKYICDKLDEIIIDFFKSDTDAKIDLYSEICSSTYKITGVHYVGGINKQIIL